MYQQSAVVLALVATNPATETELATEQEIRDHANEISSHDHKRAASISAFWSDDEYERSQLLQSLKEKHNFDKIKLKTTVILTSVSLMGQW